MKGTQLCCVRVRLSFRVDLRVRDRVCRVCEVKVYLVRGERRHRRSDERSDIAGGAIEIYRVGKSEIADGDNSKQQAQERCFCLGRPTKQCFFYDNMC